MYYKNIAVLLSIMFVTAGSIFANSDIFETASTKEIKNVKTQEELQKIKEIQESIKVEKTINLIEEKDKKSPVVEGIVAKTRNMSLEECIRLALLNNPSIKAAFENKEIYKTKIGQAWSAYFPTISAGLSYSRNRVMQTTTKLANPEYNLFNAPSLDVNMLVFDFGKTSSAARIAKKTFQASEDNLQTTINDVIYGVKEAYYALLYAFQAETVYANTVSSYEVQLEQAQNFYEIGTKPKIDVITAQYNLGNAKLDLIKAKHNIEVAYAKLNNVIGIPEHADYNIDEKFELPVYDFEFDNLLMKANETRPELLAAQKKAEASKILIGASKIAFLPDLKVFGGWTNGGVNISDNYSFQFGGGLQYNSVNLMYLKKQIDEAKATYKRDSAELEETQHKVHLDVKSALINFNDAKESIPVAKLSLLNAKEQYSLATGRYKTGLSDIIELKDAEVTYLNAQLKYYATLLNYNLTFSNLERVVGMSLIEAENNNVQSPDKEL